MSARVLRFRSRAELDDADKMREALQSIARQLRRVVQFAEARQHEEIAFGAAHLQSEALKLREKVKP